MNFSDEEIVFLIIFLDNRLTYLERDYIHDQKRLERIFNDDDSNIRLNNSLLLKKRKINMCLDILDKLKKSLE